MFSYHIYSGLFVKFYRLRFVVQMHPQNYIHQKKSNAYGKPTVSTIFISESMIICQFSQTFPLYGTSYIHKCTNRSCNAYLYINALTCIGVHTCYSFVSYIQVFRNQNCKRKWIIKPNAYMKVCISIKYT